jgi:hypothetical protein
MLKLLPVAGVLALTLALAAPAGAVPPLHDRFGVHIVDVDTETCALPVERDFVFTNDTTEFRDGAGAVRKLLLQQTTMGTLTANGTTLRLHIREAIMVEFEDGIPVSAKHVGLLDFIGGRGGPVFHRSGQAAFAVVFDPDLGFFVDGPLTARHGLRDDFDASAFCAAFA